MKTQASTYAGSLDPIGSPRTGIQTQASTLQKPGENHQSKVKKIPAHPYIQICRFTETWNTVSKNVHKKIKINT